MQNRVIGIFYKFVEIFKKCESTMFKLKYYVAAWWGE